MDCFLLLIGLTLLAGCANTPTVKNGYHPELVSAYHLDAGDRVRVIVFGQTDLSNTYVVDQAGNLSMPLIGTVPARGRSTAEIETEIARRLRKGYVRNPDVSVEIDRYRPFFVMGEVTAAGQYPYVPGMTVQQAVAIAGGFTPRANVRDGAGHPQRRRPGRAPPCCRSAMPSCPATPSMCASATSDARATGRHA